MKATTTARATERMLDDPSKVVSKNPSSSVEGDRVFAEIAPGVLPSLPSSSLDVGSAAMPGVQRVVVVLFKNGLNSR